MKSIVECTKSETGTKISRQEKGKEIYFQHAAYEIVCDVVAIDNCVFKWGDGEGEKRCDYLFLFDKARQKYNFLKNSSSLAFYVELKGIDLPKACEQLLNAIEKTKDQIQGFDISALVVSSRGFVPQYDNTQNYRNLKRLIRKDIQFEITPYTVNL